MGDKPKYKWTVFFLIRSMDGYWTYADKLIEDLRKITIHKKLSIVICLNTKASNLSNRYPRGKRNETEGNTTVFYRIESKKEDKSEKQLRFLSEQPDFDLSNPEHII